MRWWSLENLTLLGIVLGVGFGYGFPEAARSIALVGEVFLRLLKMVVVPLVFTAVFVAVAAPVGRGGLRRLGGFAFLYYLSSTALAVSTGLVLVTLLQPGTSHALQGQAPDLPAQTLSGILLSMIPANIFQSLVEGNALQIILFALLLGGVTQGLAPAHRDSLLSPMEALFQALMRLVHLVVALTPVGVFALVASLVAREGFSVFRDLFGYVVTVVLGLLIHAGITLPLLARLVGRYNPLKFFLRVREALLLAFSTASSAATLPVSLEVAQRAGVAPRVARFVLPLGATINMDGTALYEAVAAVFIANAYGVSLGFSQLLLIFLTATLASIGAAAVPSAGLVMMTLVLSSVGLPLEGIALIVSVDRFLDMLRTAVNVWGDLNGARILTALQAISGKGAKG